MATMLTLLTKGSSKVYIDPEQLAQAVRDAEAAGHSYRISPL